MDTEILEAVKYLQEKERTAVLRVLFAKLAFSIFATVIVGMGDVTVDAAYVIAMFLAAALFYALSSLFHLCLKLTRSYFVAIPLFFAVFLGIAYPSELFFRKFPILNGNYPPVLEGLITIFVALLFWIPLFLDIRKILRISKMTERRPPDQI